MNSADERKHNSFLKSCLSEAHALDADQSRGRAVDNYLWEYDGENVHKVFR